MSTEQYNEQYRQIPEYNGYTNKPTWLVSLWLSNDYSSYCYWQRQAKEAVEDHEEEALYHLEMQLKEDHESFNPVTQASVYSDLLNWSLAYVNWREIAEHLIEDAKEEIENES